MKVSNPSVATNVGMIGERIISATRFSIAHFIIHTTDAGQGVLDVKLSDELGNILPLKIDNETDANIFDV